MAKKKNRNKNRKGTAEREATRKMKRVREGRGKWGGESISTTGHPRHPHTIASRANEITAQGA